MNSKYHAQKKNADSFKDNIDSDEDRVQLDTVNSNENIQDERVAFQENVQETSPYVMTIEIDKGISEKLQIYYDSVPEEVAYEFCKKHNLDYSALNYLVEEIKNVLSQNANEENKEPEPIAEEEDESMASEENTNKLTKSEENFNVSGYKNQRGEPYHSNNFLNENQKNSKNSHKQDNLQGSLQDEITYTTNNNIYNQSTNHNENHTEVTSNVIYSHTEPNYKESQQPTQQSVANSQKKSQKTRKTNETYVKKSSKIQEKDLKNFEQKLFSYQIFLDKNKSSKEISFSHLNNTPANKSMKNISSNNSVFDKLYNESKLRKQLFVKVANRNTPQNTKVQSKDHLTNILNNKINKHILNQLTGNQNRDKPNAGERLYRKGISLKENVEISNNKQRKEQLQKSKEIYTFKPNLKKKNILLKSQNMEENKEEPVDVLERFEYYKRKNEEKIKELREIYESKEEYPFAPKIDENSEKMVKAKYDAFNENEETAQHNRRDKNKELYEMARLKPVKLQNLGLAVYGEYNYQPAVNPSKKEYPDFYSRQREFSKNKEEKIVKLKIEKEESVDNKTGQRLFTPKINNSGQENVNYFIKLKRNGKKIYENLFNLSVVQREKNRSSNDQHVISILKEAKRKHTDENTEIIFIQKKINIFRKLFKLIDSDEDGEISIFSVNFNKVPKKLMKILQPIIKPMKEFGNKYNEENFVLACENLYNSLIYEDKKEFLNFPKQVNMKKNSSSCSSFSFKPEINNRSKILDNFSRKTRSQSKAEKSVCSTEKLHQKSILNISTK